MTTASDRGDCLWVVTEDRELCLRAEVELRDIGCRVRQVVPAGLDNRDFWRSCPRFPGVVLLDVDEELDRARTILRAMKQVRVPSPVIAVTANPSREFGTKIVSLGVSYFLPREFAAGELAEVFVNLIRPRRGEPAPPA